MSSIQERLQLKRVPLDNWSVREKLCLASAVACSGDQNWMSVSRSLRMLCSSNRPSDWFSQKSCAAQYGKLLENVDAPKRKKRTEKDAPVAVETPSEIILRKLTQERLIELKKLIVEKQQQYAKVKEDIANVQTADEAKLREMWNQIEMENNQKEKEHFQHSQMLKAREERKIELEKAWRPGSIGQSSPKASLSIKLNPDEMDVDDGMSQCTPPIRHGTSPLLTSLLKSPSPASNLASPTTSQTNSTSVVRNLLSTKSNFINECPLIPTQSNPVIEPSTLTQTPQIELSVTRVSTSCSSYNENICDKTDVKLDNIDFRDLTRESQSSPEENRSSKDDEQLMDVFNSLIPDNIDELADILTDHNDILSPAMLDEDEEEEEDSLVTEQDETMKVNKIDVKDVDKTLSEIEEIEKKSEDADENLIECSKNDKLTVEVDAKDDVKEFKSENVPSPVKIEMNTETEMHDVIIIKEEAYDETSTNEPTKIEEVEIKDEKNVIPSNDESKTNINFDQTLDVEVEKTNEEDVVMVGAVDSNEDVIDVSEKDENNEVTEILNSNPSEAEKSVEIINLEEDNTMQDQYDVEKETKPVIVEDSENEATKDDKDNKPILDIKDEENLKYTPTIEIKSNESSVDNRKMSSDDEVYEDAKEYEELKPTTPVVIELIQSEPPICIVDTDEESPSDSVNDKKDLKLKRDYTRKKSDAQILTPEPIATISRPIKSEEHPSSMSEDKSSLSIRMKLKERDRSESPLVLDDDNEIPRTRRRYSSTPVIDSIPNSPASSDDRDFRMWKKNVYNIYNCLTSHKHANMFLKIENNFLNYKSTILRPVDLPSIKKNIDAGLIKTTSEFQRDIMLMCHNMIMILPRNSPDVSSVIEFRADALSSIESTLDLIKKEEKLIVTTPVGVNSIKGRGGRKSSRMSNI